MRRIDSLSVFSLHAGLMKNLLEANSGSMNNQWYRRKWIVVLGHAIAWIILFSLPYFLKPSYNNNHPAPPPHDIRYDYDYIINCFTWIGLFYLNALVLIPRFINRKRYKAYLFSIILVIVLLFFVNWAFFILLLPHQHFQVRVFAFFYLFPCLFILASSTAYKMLQDKAVQDRKVKERETENLKTELAFLRSQVSPHFMFNVLNNMVALARKKSDILEPSLIKLSSLLRYMLYETDEEKVPMEKEIEYLQSYIDLQQQRFGKNVGVKACLKNIDDSYWMAPMLLIPFVENAFKHGTGLFSDAFIDIDLMARNGILTFTVTNKYNPQTEEVRDKTSGIGLNNVTRRLNLLYPGKHTLLINKNKDRFIVSLQLNLQ